MRGLIIYTSHPNIKIMLVFSNHRKTFKFKIAKELRMSNKNEDDRAIVAELLYDPEKESLSAAEISLYIDQLNPGLITPMPKFHMLSDSPFMERLSPNGFKAFVYRTPTPNKSESKSVSKAKTKTKRSPRFGGEKGYENKENEEINAKSTTKFKYFLRGRKEERKIEEEGSPEFVRKKIKLA